MPSETHWTTNSDIVTQNEYNVKKLFYSREWRH
jgi:hypothetical protein